MTLSRTLRLSARLRLAACGLALAGLTHCADDGRAQRFPDAQLQDRTPPSALPDADLPEEELDAGGPSAPDEPQDAGAGDEFVKYWDGSTTPTSDYVRHVDAGEVDVRGSDALEDASAP